MKTKEGWHPVYVSKKTGNPLKESPAIVTVERVHSLTLEQVSAVSQGVYVELHQTAAERIDKARAWIEKNRFGGCGYSAGLWY